MEVIPRSLPTLAILLMLQARAPHTPGPAARTEAHGDPELIIAVRPSGTEPLHVTEMPGDNASSPADSPYVDTAGHQVRVLLCSLFPLPVLPFSSCSAPPWHKDPSLCRPGGSEPAANICSTIHHMIHNSRSGPYLMSLTTAPPQCDANFKMRSFWVFLYILPAITQSC